MVTIKTGLYIGLLTLLMLTTSCSTCCRRWESNSIASDSPCMTFVKVYLPASSTFKGLNAELIYEQDGPVFYLTALTFMFPESESPGKTVVYFEIKSQWYSGEALRLQGGQKLVLPFEMQEQIVSALVEGNTVNIVIGRYQETLIPDNFTLKGQRT